jgi:poly(3-hydroxybutyrate) depolymerase
MLRVAQIAELKHAWSGGDERLPYNAAGGPDASRMLLDFFARHRRNA